MRRSVYAILLSATLPLGCTIERVYHVADSGDPAAGDAATSDAGPDAGRDSGTDACVLMTYYADADEDGYGDPASSTTACAPPTGYVTSADDCDDGNDLIHPAAVDICDGVDNDCDETTDEAATADPSCSLPNATAICGSGGTCVVASCTGAWRDCNMTDSDGCEEDTASSPAHCGGCGSACGVAAECTIGSCDTVALVRSSGEHSCVVRSGGGVACWGVNGSGQLGDGTTMVRMAPVAVLGLSTAIDVAPGGNHTCALLVGGTVACWGENASGQLGDGTTTSRSTMAPVSGLTDAVAVASGFAHTCARLVSGQVRCWGSNSAGQLGDGSTALRRVPTAVATLSDAVELATGVTHTCARRAGGSVSCWGANSAGQLGTGDNAASTVPRTVTGITSAAELAAGSEHTCARLSTGEIRCWGSNSAGQLGNGESLTTSNLPVTAATIAAPTQIAAGGAHSCAVQGSGAIKCWGGNFEGQLGDGTTTSRSNAVFVVGTTDALLVASGEQHSCALSGIAPEVLCWGSNSQYQLGDGTTDRRTSPIPVSDLP